MGFAEAVIAFIVIGMPTIMIFGLVSRAYRHREMKLELEARIATAKAAQGDPLLEQRVRVLERIVTEKGHALSEEIEQLRVTGR